MQSHGCVRGKLEVHYLAQGYRPLQLFPDWRSLRTTHWPYEWQTTCSATLLPQCNASPMSEKINNNLTFSVESHSFVLQTLVNLVSIFVYFYSICSSCLPHYFLLSVFMLRFVAALTIFLISFWFLIVT